MGTQLLLPEIRGDGSIARWVWLNGRKHHLLDCASISLLERTPAQKLPAREDGDGRDNLVRAALAAPAPNGACYLEHDGLTARRQFRELARRGLTADRWVNS